MFARACLRSSSDGMSGACSTQAETESESSAVRTAREPIISPPWSWAWMYSSCLAFARFPVASHQTIIGGSGRRRKRARGRFFAFGHQGKHRTHQRRGGAREIFEGFARKVKRHRAAGGSYRRGRGPVAQKRDLAESVAGAEVGQVKDIGAVELVHAGAATDHDREAVALRAFAQQLLARLARAELEACHHGRPLRGRQRAENRRG